MRSRDDNRLRRTNLVAAFPEPERVGLVAALVGSGALLPANAVGRRA